MVKLIAVSKGISFEGGEDLISYVARVSSPQNQEKFDTAPKLLKYLIKHNHLSPFEHAYLTLEIKTSRGIAAQILRHRSFVFQEFSQRFSAVTEMVKYPARSQDTKNRQNSHDDCSEGTKAWFDSMQDQVWTTAYGCYQRALEAGIAKEQARFLLPLNTATTLYMTGNVRSWMHYIELRSGHGTQKEHMNIALECKNIFKSQFPSIAQALEWI